jgi:hypothetical protein
MQNVDLQSIASLYFPFYYEQKKRARSNEMGLEEFGWMMDDEIPSRSHR